MMVPALSAANALCESSNVEATSPSYQARTISGPSPFGSASAGPVPLESTSSNAEASPSSSREPGKGRKGRELWDVVVKKVLRSIGISRQFRTLRDHGGVNIRRSDLQQIGILGQGVHAPTSWVV